MPSIIAHSGIVRLSRKQLERLAAANERIDIHLTGLLVVAHDVSPALAAASIGRVRLKGVLRASGGVRAVLRQKQPV